MTVVEGEVHRELAPAARPLLQRERALDAVVLPQARRLQLCVCKELALLPVGLSKGGAQIGSGGASAPVDRRCVGYKRVRRTFDRATWTGSTDPRREGPGR